MVQVCTLLVGILQTTVTVEAGPLPVLLPVSAHHHTSASSLPQNPNQCTCLALYLQIFPPSFPQHPSAFLPLLFTRSDSPCWQSPPRRDTLHTVSVLAAPQIQALRGSLGTFSLPGPQLPTASGCSHCSSWGDSPLKGDTSLPTLLLPCAGVHLSETTSKTNLWPGASKPL